MLNKILEFIELMTSRSFWPMFAVFFLLLAMAAYTLLESI